MSFFTLSWELFFNLVVKGHEAAIELDVVGRMDVEEAEEGGRIDFSASSQALCDLMSSSRFAT